MAYQFADGFDNYGNAFNMVSGYPWTTAGAGWITSTADYRFAPPGSLPGGCLTEATANPTTIQTSLSSNQGTVIVGVGIKIPTLPGSGVLDIIQLSDLGTEQIGLCVNSNGALQFYRGGAGGTAVGTLSPNNTITAGAWYGTAFQATIATGTAGAVAVYINGSATPIINSTGLNTSQSTNNYCNQVSLGPKNVGTSGLKFDDFYCFDSTGSYLNSLLGGDARVLTKMPASAGNYTNWTPTGLSSNFQNAAVQPPSTSDYNANNTGGTKDSYTMQLASLGVAPYFVLARASMERDDAGTHTPSIFVRSGSTDSSGVVTPALTSSYVFYDAVFQNDPATSSSWTGTGADNAQVGVIEG